MGRLTTRLRGMVETHKVPDEARVVVQPVTFGGALKRITILPPFQDPKSYVASSFELERG